MPRKMEASHTLYRSSALPWQSAEPGNEDDVLAWDDFFIPQSLEDVDMTRVASTAVFFALATTAASAQAPQNMQRQAGPPAQVLANVPNNGVTVTHWYKQNVYDPADNKIGEIMDVLLDREGKATALIIGVGGFLGLGEKDVAVPFNAVRATTKDNNKWYLVMNSSKDALKKARGFRYDRTNMTWMPEDAPATTGAPNLNR